MKIVFRTDASFQIGAGHVMRCLTLAEALEKKGAKCYFICRDHLGSLIELISHKGYPAYSLPRMYDDPAYNSEGQETPYSKWLGASQQEDAEQCRKVIDILQPDWLIVDHYGIDSSWESEFRTNCCKVMVIDDLADRPHNCDVLLDQTFARQSSDYIDLVPESCLLLCGSKYALLRPEFEEWRAYSLKRRRSGVVRQLLINLGGVDNDNITVSVLKKLKSSGFPHACRVVVVMGATAPWINDVQQVALSLPFPTEVKVGANNMARLMAESDLAIGAAGSTALERCCVGLPSIMLMTAKNQANTAAALVSFGAAILDTTDMRNTKAFFSRNQHIALSLTAMSVKANKVTDGLGVSRVIDKLRRR